MFDFIHTLPLWSAKVGAVIIFGVMLVVAWLLPEDFIYLGAPNKKRWRDLRIWATLLIIVQFIIYAIF